MKKLSKLIALAITLGALVFAGCSNGLNNAVVKDPDAVSKTITMTVSGDSDYLVFPEATDEDARTIVPAALDGENLDFYWWAKDKLGSSTKYQLPAKIDFTAISGTYGRVGSVELNMDTSQWEIYLAAIEQSKSFSLAGNTGDVDNLLKDAELLATATVDMRYNERISFYLTPNTNTTATGDVALTIGTNWAIVAPYTTVGNIIFSLKSLSDGQPLTTPIDTVKKPDATAIAAMSNATPSSANYTLSGVASGTYNMEVCFKNTETNKSYIWSDTIIILPNQTTAQTIIVPNIIGITPAAPENFTVRYNEPENYTSDYYAAQFVWDDKSNNEHYFQLDLMDVPEQTSDANKTLVSNFIAATTVTAKDTAWQALVTAGIVTVESLDYTVYSDPRFVSGKDATHASGLYANNESVTLNLPLGKRYFVRLSAANDGNSTYVYPDFTITQTTKAVIPYKDSTGAVVSTMKYFSTLATSVNLFKITYNFVNGAYHETEYADDGEVKTIKDATADQSKISTLNNDLTADVRYYTQVTSGKELTMEKPSDWAWNYTAYFTSDNAATPTYTAVATAATTPEWEAGKYYKTSDNYILNPLKVIYYNSTVTPATTTYYSLAKNGTSWSAWKNQSTSGTTLYKLGSTGAKPTQVLTAPETLYPNPYTSFQNLDLFAVYATTVQIYNPADYAILDSDILIYKTTASATDGIADTSAVQVATIDESNTFVVNTDSTAGYSKVYVAVRNNLYSKIKLSIKDSSSGLRYDYVGSSTKEFLAPRYVLLTSEPADWSTDTADKPTQWQNYYKKSGHSYTAVDDASVPTWKANTYYYKTTYLTGDKAAQFTYFEIPVAAQFAPGSVYTVTVAGYTNKSSITPFTYPLTMNIISTSTASYSPTTFEPLDWASATAGIPGKYFMTSDSGTSYIANTNTTWKAGTATKAATEVWQKD